VSTWHVCTHDWPVGAPLSSGAVARVIAEFDRWHEVALESLARTSPPADHHARRAGENTEAS
jgi:hypothetical protein